MVVVEERKREAEEGEENLGESWRRMGPAEEEGRRYADAHPGRREEAAVGGAHRIASSQRCESCAPQHQHRSAERRPTKRGGALPVLCKTQLTHSSQLPTHDSHLKLRLKIAPQTEAQAEAHMLYRLLYYFCCIHT